MLLLVFYLEEDKFGSGVEEYWRGRNWRWEDKLGNYYGFLIRGNEGLN